MRLNRERAKKAYKNKTIMETTARLLELEERVLKRKKLGETWKLRSFTNVIRLRNILRGILLEKLQEWSDKKELNQEEIGYSDLLEDKIIENN